MVPSDHQRCDHAELLRRQLDDLIVDSDFAVVARRSGERADPFVEREPVALLASRSARVAALLAIRRVVASDGADQIELVVGRVDGRGEKQQLRAQSSAAARGAETVVAASTDEHGSAHRPDARSHATDRRSAPARPAFLGETPSLVLHHLDDDDPPAVSSVERGRFEVSSWYFDRCVSLGERVGPRPLRQGDSLRVHPPARRLLRPESAEEGRHSRSRRSRIVDVGEAHLRHGIRFRRRPDDTHPPRCLRRTTLVSLCGVRRSRTGIPPLQPHRLSRSQTRQFASRSTGLSENRRVCSPLLLWFLSVRLSPLVSAFAKKASATAARRARFAERPK